jgi:Zn-finger nucleic acid-binding protein
MCPENHGVALTLAEGYESAQEDEMRLLWQLAMGRRPDVGHPRPSDRGCPGCSMRMVTVDLPYDDDEVDEGNEGDGENLGEIEVEVCTMCQFVWFDAGELEELPADLPDPELSADQQAQLDRIISDFGNQMASTFAERDGRDPAERFARRVAGRPGLHRGLARATFWSSRDDEAAGLR